jgi:hypothetical protein
MAKKTILLFNPSNAVPSAPIQEPASGGVSGTMSNFFHDANNIGFTSADGEQPWYLVHNYNEKVLKLYRNYSRWNLSKVPIQEPASGGASMSTSRMQVLNMRVYDVLLHV